MNYSIMLVLLVLLAIGFIAMLFYFKERLTGVKLMLIGTNIILLTLLTAAGNFRIATEGILMVAFIGIAFSITGLFYHK